MGSRGAIHHLELWVSDVEAAEASLGWLLRALGYQLADSWTAGRSWRLGNAYIVLESGPDVLPTTHERRRPGLNHLAFRAGSERDVDELTAEAVRHGWTLLFADRHPHAGGPAHYAAFLEKRRRVRGRAGGFLILRAATHDLRRPDSAALLSDIPLVAYRTAGACGAPCLPVRAV